MTDVRNLVVLLAVAVPVIAFGWTGFIASDDWSYLSNAEGWVANFPHVGDTHWAHRHTLVLPLAAVIALLGSSEIITIAVAIAWYLALVVAAYAAVRMPFGPTVAVAAAGLTAITPAFALQATVLNVDIPETVFALLAVTLFWRATQSRQPAPLLVLAGAALGFAVLARLTALGLGALYGVLFLGGAYFSRWKYWIVAGAAAAVIGAQMLFFAATVGDPLYAIETTLDASAADGRGLGSLSPFRPGSGNVSDDRLLGPPLALLVNQEFALLYWAFVPAAFVCWRGNGLTDAQRTFCRLLIGMAVLWFLWIGYTGAVRPKPRYFGVSTISAAIVVAVALRCVLWKARPLYAWIAASAVSAAALLCIDLDNKQLRFGERTLASYVGAANETIYTNPLTALRAQRFLEWTGSDATHRLAGTPPPPGALFFDHRRRVPPADRGYFDEEAYRVGSEWSLIWSSTSTPSLSGRLLSLVGADALLPASLAERLLRPGGTAEVYRVPEARPASQLR